MQQKQIDSLKRWDRVHCIRDLSTKAASDSMGDRLERYARGEKMKLSNQKQMYRYGTNQTSTVLFLLRLLLLSVNSIL